jgi:hypothetical protein
LEIEGIKYAAVLPEPRKNVSYVIGLSKDPLASLSHGDDISRLQDSWDGVGLHWCGILVATKVDIVDHNWVKARSVELR